MPGHFFGTGQRQGLLQAAPAIEQDEHREDADPHILQQERNPDQAGDPREANDGGHQQTARPPHNKPEEGPENLAAIERIDGEHVKNQQYAVDPTDGQEQPVHVAPKRTASAARAGPDTVDIGCIVIGLTMSM